MTTTSTIPGLDSAPTKNAELVAWVTEVAELTQPDRVEWADGSEQEWQRLTQLLVDAGVSGGAHVTEYRRAVGTKG